MVREKFDAATAALVDAGRAEGWRAVSVSIDDFYLTYAQQLALAERHRLPLFFMRFSLAPSHS